MDRQKSLNAINLSKVLSPQERLDLERKTEVEEIFKLLSRKGSEALYCSLIERLYFYLDFSFVREALMKIYRTTKSDAIKRKIKALHDGTLDMSKYLEERDAFDDLDSYAREIDAEYYRDLEKDESLRNSFDPKLLKAILKQI